MVYCIKCGAELIDGAEYCTKCGTQIKIKDKKSLEEQIEVTAERFGKKVEQIGERIEKRADAAGNYFNKWYDNTFNFAGPLIGAFIFLIILRIIIYIIQNSGDDIHILTAFSEGLITYLLIVFVSTLISGYNRYINRKYKQQYQWIYPLVSVVTFIIGAWIIAKIMLYIHNSDTTPIIGAIGGFIDTYLIGIFIIALIIAYNVQFYKFQEKKQTQK